MDCLNIGSCLNTSISAPDAQEINLMCYDDYSCLGLNINGKFSKSINIICTSNSTQQSCNTLNIIATNISNELNIECYGEYGCENINIDALYGNIINLISKGIRPLYSSNIYASYAKKVNIISYAENYIWCANDISCASNFYLPSFNSKSDKEPPTTITCQGLGCYNLNLYSLNGLLDYTFILNGCGICSAGYSCYADWNIFCGSKYQNELTVWSGQYCWDDYCGCYEQQSVLTNSWDAHNSLTCEEHSTYNYTCRYDKINYPGYCIIDCDVDIDGCRNQIINATNEKSSIIINCGNSGRDDNDDDSNRGAYDLGLCENTKIYCPNKNNSECIINCIEDDSCTYAKIYSKNNDDFDDLNNKLWINCSDYGSCEFTKIVAPKLKQVDVFCDNTDACYGLQVEATFVDTMNIICKSSEETINYYNYYWWEDDTDSDGGGRRRRRRTRRRMRRRLQSGRDGESVPSAPAPVSSFYDDVWEDWDTDWGYYNNWDYNSNYACDQITIDANYSNNFNIFCDGNNSCFYSMFYGEYSSNINLTSIGQESFYYSYLYSNNVKNEVNIQCLSGYDYGKTESDLEDWYGYDYWSWFNYGACVSAYFYIPSQVNNKIKTNFVCEGYGCYNLNLYTLNGLEDFNLLIDGCKVCESIDECIGQWSLSCGYNFYNFDYFDGKDCSYQQCNCDQTQITYQDTLECAYKYNNGTYYPTPSPTFPSSFTTTPTKNAKGSNNNNTKPKSHYYAVVGCVLSFVILCCIIIFCYHRRLNKKRLSENEIVNNNGNNNHNNIKHEPVPINDDINMAKALAMEAVEGAETTRNNFAGATMVVPNSIDDDVKENNNNDDKDEELYAQFIPPATFNDDNNKNENDNVGLIN